MKTNYVFAENQSLDTPKVSCAAIFLCMIAMIAVAKIPNLNQHDSSPVTIGIMLPLVMVIAISLYIGFGRAANATHIQYEDELAPLAKRNEHIMWITIAICCVITHDCIFLELTRYFAK